jgi:asparagine synthase (glutamine-hydrolysing)
MRRYHERSRPWVRFRLPQLAPENKANLLKEILDLDSQARRVYEIRTMHLPRLLKWDDRNFMAFSVEGRYPFLDHQLIELCLSYAPRLLYNLGWTKYPLRLALDGRLPPKVLHRRSKYGFETPQSEWLCGVLRPIVENWLRQDRPAWDYLERDYVKRVAEQTWRLNGKRKEPGLTLLRIYMFDRWLDIFGLRN